MNDKPLISIVIATYNRATVVGSAIKSALAQTYPNKQIIVVDDGSADNTAEIVKAFPQVEYVLQPHARQAAARNNGYQHSKGAFIATLDSDDRWHPQFLEKCVAFLEKENLDFVFANWDQQRREGGTFDFLANDPLLIPYLPNLKNSWVILEPYQLRGLYIKGCPSPSSSMVLRASSITKGWNTKMHIGDDWCMLLDMIMPGKCRAAFTLERLWSKHIDSKNLYDGRNHIEVNRLLFVEDMRTLMLRYQPYWTRSEYKSVEKKYLKNLVRSAKHSLFIYSNVMESISLMKRAIVTNPIYTTKVFTSLFVNAGKRRLNNDTAEVQ